MTSITSKLHLLQYQFAENILEKRAAYRQAHSEYVGKQVQIGNVLLAGPVGYPPIGGLIIFRNLTSDDIEQFAQQDPYLTNGVFTGYTIQPYLAAAGDALLRDDLIKI